MTELFAHIAPDGAWDMAEQRELSRRLQAALKKLTPQQRRRVIAYYFYGLTYRQIAQMEGVHFTAVATGIKRALAQL